MTRSARTIPRGFTLLELMLVVVILGIIVGPALGFLRDQAQAFRTGSERVLVTQTHRFALESLERDIRLAGAGVRGVQPVLVYADSMVLAFNADYRSRVPDPYALYHEASADSNEVNVLTEARKITIPGSSWQYPSADYTGGAETFVLFFRPDSTTARTDDFILFRQINDTPPEVLARNILRSSAGPFFEYLRSNGNALVALTELPVRHDSTMHNTRTDDEMIDSIRVVRINLGVTNGRVGKGEQKREVSRRVWVINSERDALDICGRSPLPVSGMAAVLEPNPSGGLQVRLTWLASLDQDNGEKDLVRYVVWRRPNGTTGWTEPIGSVPAGTLTYVDKDSNAGDFQYAVAAQDCSPSMSSKQMQSILVP